MLHTSTTPRSRHPENTQKRPIETSTRYTVEARFRVTRLVFTALSLLSCQSLLDFGSEPSLRTSEEEAVGGAAGSTSLGIAGITANGGKTGEDTETEGRPEVESGGTGGVTVQNGSAPRGGTSGQGTASGGESGASVAPNTEYACSVDVVLATHDCKGPVQITQLGAAKGTVVVDMSGYRQLTLRVEVTDPTGYILDIGDSPCVDGGGGDCGLYSNDAELDVQQSVQGGDVTLSMYGSDLIARTGNSVALGTIPTFFAASGSSTRTLVLSSGKVCVENPSSCSESPALLTIGAPDAENPTPDNYWYIGLNRVVWNVYRDPPREGSGLRKATLQLR